MNYQQVVPQTLLKRHRIIDSWFPLRYSLDLYKGCTAGCHYCPANFIAKEKTITTYSDVVGKLERELAVLDKFHTDATLYHGRTEWNYKQLIGLGAGLHDPLMPLAGMESASVLPEVLDLTTAAGHQTLILTKYPNRLEEFLASKRGETFLTKAASTVSTTSTSSAFPQTLEPIVLSAFTLFADEEEEACIEPGVPSSTQRLAALQSLHRQGLPTGALILSLAPWEEEKERQRLTELLNQLYEVGVNFITLNFLFSESAGRVYKRLYSKRESSPSLERFRRGSEGVHEYQANSQENQTNQKTSPSVALFAREQGRLERDFKQVMKNLGLPFMPPSLLYRGKLSPKDAVAATFIQMYYLLKDMGKQRDFLKMAAYQLSLLSEHDFADAIVHRRLKELPGIGNYCEQLILKMALKEDYGDFDRTFLSWYQF